MFLAIIFTLEFKKENNQDKTRRNEEHEEKLRKTFVLFVSSWFYFG